MIAVEREIIQRIQNYNPVNTFASAEPINIAQQEHDKLIGTIYNLIYPTEQRFLNMELSDIDGILEITGSGLIGLAEVSGTDKALKAVGQATLLTTKQQASLKCHSQALLGIITGNEAEFEVEEFYTITEYLQSMLVEEAEIIYGHGKDHSLGDKIRVFVVIPI